MKKIYFLLLAFSLFTTANAQIVDIPDANFKAWLLAADTSNFTAKNLTGSYLKIDANSDGQIQESEALNVSYLFLAYIGFSKISDLTGIEKFTNLKYLNCSSNNLSSLDVSKLVNLFILNCGNNNLSSLDVTKLVNLKELYCDTNKLSFLDVATLFNLNILDCGKNNLTTLDVAPLVNLRSLACYNNKLSDLDITKNAKLGGLDCTNNLIKKIDLTLNLPGQFYLQNNQLESLFIKNNRSDYDATRFFDNPTLKYICVDEEERIYIQKKVTDYGYTNCVVNSYCSFVPGGTYYTIQGNQKYGSNANGCDALDAILPNLKFNITDGTATGNFISNSSGNYTIPVLAGTHTITPVIENPSYFNVSPTTATVTFPTQSSPYTQNFCISANGVHPDLEVSLLPLQPARPGFDAKYKLVYKNKGNQTQSGSVNLGFDDAVLDLVVSNPVTTTQTTNNLSWNFTNLLPFEARAITFTLNVNSPLETPAVNSGSVLVYNATITSAAADETPLDNTFAFNQTVVNSFDPNDKTCLEGSTVSPSLIGQFVHYMIRFEKLRNRQCPEYCCKRHD